MDTTHTSDLFRRCVQQQRDDDWQQFVHHHGPRLLRSANEALGGMGRHLTTWDSEDILQEVFCRLLSLKRNFQGFSEGQVFGYLRRLTVRLTIDLSRKHRARKRRCRFSEHFDNLDELACLTPSPKDRLMAKREWVRFLRLCREVTAAPYRGLVPKLVRLAYVEGYSSREIAHRLRDERISHHLIDVLLHRLRRRLAARGLKLPRRCGQGASMVPCHE